MKVRLEVFMPGDSEMVLLFQLRNRTFSLPLAVIEEILPAVTQLPVPGSEQTLEGVIEVRGEIVPVFDFGAVLELGHTEICYTDHLIVLKVNSGKIAVRVERALELVNLAEMEMGGVGASKIAGTLVSAVAKHKDSLVSMLEPQVVSKLMSVWQKDDLLTSSRA